MLILNTQTSGEEEIQREEVYTKRSKKVRRTSAKNLNMDIRELSGNENSTQIGFNEKRPSFDIRDKIPEEKNHITFTQVAQTNVGCMLEEAPLLYKHA